jgi:hypothetical protein
MSPSAIRRLWAALAGLLVLRVTFAVVWNYRRYFPPDFESDFLHGRAAYFFDTYQWAFYPHLIVGPVTLVLGMLLLSDRFRMLFPKWHRILGRVQGMCVLLVIAPTGLWMAGRAEAGPIAGVGFALLSILTAASVALGWRAAVRRRFAEHRRWMMRCYLMLCSTVVLRLLAGLATVSDAQSLWIDLITPWVSWIVPLAAFELLRAANRTFERSPLTSGATSVRR